MVATVGGVGQGVRDLNRLQHVARILVRHGLGALVAGIPGLPTIPGRKKAEPTLDTTPDRLVAALQELGPTFVKLGQVLSTRPDILSEAYCEALAQLQDDVDALPFAAIEAQLRSSLGAEWEQGIIFDKVPLATASIAQVHRAQLASGASVVFKIQRPGIAHTIQADLNILHFLARRILAEVPEAESFNPVGVLGEFERSVQAELDFGQEADHIRYFQRNFEGDASVHIPRVYPEYTRPTVLCMEYLEGTKMRHARAAGCDMRRVGERYLKCAYDQLFVHGLFHGDLHPGNVIVMDGEVIGLIDFGMVGRLTQEMRDNTISIMFALQRGDYRTIARLFYEIAIKDERVDYRVVERETVEVMNAHWSGESVKDMALGPFIMDLAHRAARQGCRIPINYTMLFKGIMTSEGLAKTLIEEVDPIAAIEPYFRRMMTQRFSPENLEKELYYNLFSMQSLIARLPVTLSQFLDDADAQRVRFAIQNVADRGELDAADRRVNRLIVAGLAVTCACCGTVALLTPAAWPFGVPLVAIGFYLCLVPLVVLLALMVVRNRG